MYYRVLPCIIVVLHNVNTRASDTPQIRRDTTVIHVFRELSHELCRYISDTSTIRPIHAQYFLKITKDHDGDCFLTLGRPTHELLAEEGDEQVEEDEDEGEGEGQGPTAEQTAVMQKAWEDATAGQGEEEEQEGRGKRARKPKPQAEVPAKSIKKKGSPKKKGK